MRRESRHAFSVEIDGQRLQREHQHVQPPERRGEGGGGGPSGKHNPDTPLPVGATQAHISNFKSSMRSGAWIYLHPQDRWAMYTGGCSARERLSLAWGH